MKPGDPVKPGQSIGVQGGVGVDGVGKPPGASHAHIQVYKGSDPTPLNPLRHLYEYHYPGQPILPLPELEPYSVPPRHAARANPDSEHDPVLAPPSPDAPPGNPEPAAPNTQPPTLPPSQFSPRQPAPQPPSSIGPPLELRRRGLRAPPTPVGKIVPGSTGATGQLYFNPPSSPRQFGPFTLPGADNSPMDILAPRDGNPGGSSIPIVSTPGQFGNDLGNAPPGASLQPTNGNAADRTGGNDIGGMWATAQQYISVQPARMQPAAAPSYDMPGAFPESGAAPIGYLNGASQTGTFDPAASGVPLPRPRPPQTPASWPSSPVAPLQMPQADAAAPWHQDGQEAGDGPRQNLPNWAQMQPPTENTFPAPNAIDGMAGDQPLPLGNGAPQPALTVQNLTTHVLRMKGVPEADIGAAINDPAKMQNLLSQVYGRRSMIAPGDGTGGFGNQFDQAISGGQPGQAAAPAAAPPNDYIPFGWSGLPPLLR